MDIEWAKDGDDGQLYIIQARPETVVSQRAPTGFETYALGSVGHRAGDGPRGRREDRRGCRAGHRRRASACGVQAGRGSGRGLDDARLGAGDEDLRRHRDRARRTDLPCGDCRARTRHPGRRRGGGCKEGTEDRRAGDGLLRGGEVGRVYEGALPIKITHIELSEIKRPRTKIMLNLGNPELAFRTAMLPNDGVGLARMEFIISEHIKVHPMALVSPEKVVSAQARQEIEQLVRNYPKPADYFIEKLSEGIGMIGAAFYPKPVIVRLSDFKTNEYARLLGGEGFEPKEENPMLGFRGAARYAHPAYAAGFALECAALTARARRHGPDECPRHGAVLPARGGGAARPRCHGQPRSQTRREMALKIYVMCEIPNNVIQIDAFAKLFDGFSIGSNDLTQLTLGVDRDSEIVAFDFDERDPGMLEMLRLAVVGAKRNGRHVGICGEAPGQLSGNRPLPDAARHQFDQRQSFEHSAHHAGGERSRRRYSDASPNIGAVNFPQFVEQLDSGGR